MTASGQYPFSPGDRSISAALLNQIVEAVLPQITARHGPTLGAGVKPAERRTVVILDPPTETSRKLRVRRVKYKGGIPIPCTAGGCDYEAVGDPFDAYFDIGTTFADFEGQEWDGGPLTEETAYFKAHIEDGTWRVEKPGGGAPAPPNMIGKLVEFTSARTAIVNVYRYSPETGAVEQVFIENEETQTSEPKQAEVILWDDATNLHFEILRQRGKLLEILNFNGILIVKQDLIWNMAAPTTQRLSTGCI